MLSFLASLVPLLQTILWIWFAWFLLNRFGRDIAKIVNAIAERISQGDRLKVAGLIELEQKAVKEVRNGVEEHKALIDAGASKETLEASAQKIVAATTQLSTANNALSVALKPADLTVGSPDLSRRRSTTMPSE